MTRNSILIVGTGALATFFACRLAAAGIKVTMLGTCPEGLAILNEKGAQIEGEGRTFPVLATDDPAKCKGIHFALVLVKSWQTERAAHQLSICLAKGGLALTLQNGLGNDTILINSLGPERVARGVTTVGVTLRTFGMVSLGGDGIVTVEKHSRLSRLVEMINIAGFVINVANDLQPLVWQKLAVSCAINPLTALLRVKNGELLKNPSARALMSELVSETVAVARTLGIVLSIQKPELMVEEVALKTAGNQSSMLQDILRGAPTEIDFINGAVVRLADQEFLQVPVNRIIWSLVKALPVRGKIAANG
jgi:2-dehydropantoate 2-reductase